MRLIKPMKLGMLYKVYQEQNENFMSVAVLAMCPLGEGAKRTFLPETELWDSAGEILGDTVLDECMPKKRGEFLVRGKCHAPEGKEVQASEVAVEVGPLSKRLYVFGDRRWERAAGVLKVITDPEPFTEMPISWDRAFGGKDFPENPAGKGLNPVAGDKDGKVHPLPNIEDPEKLIGSPGDKPAPAGFGPIEVTWQPRAGRAGTYGEKWLNELFPGLAADIDWRFFNVAPKDQQLKEGYWRGDESVAAKGMHPSKKNVRGTMPGFRARCFVNRERGGALEFKELTASLDTVWVLPGAERALLVYRAAAKVADDEAADIKDLMIAYEDMESPRDVQHYIDTFARKTDPKKGPMAILDDSDLCAPGDGTVIEDLAGADVFKPEGELKKNLEARAEIEREKAEKEFQETREKIAFLGLNPDDYMPASIPEPDPEPDPEDIDVDKIRDDLLELAQKQREEMEAEARKVCENMGQDYDKLMAEAKEMAERPHRINFEVLVNQLRFLNQSSPEIEEKLEFAREKIRETYRYYVHMLDELEHIPPEDAGRLRDLALGMVRDGKPLAGADFTGADLSNLDLRGRDLSGAIVEKADLSGADLREANLEGTVLAWARLNGARLEGSNMKGANLGSANLEKADCSGADMTKAVLDRAILSGALFKGAVLEGASFMETSFAGADFGGAELSKTVFLQNDLSGISFVEAGLGQAIFFESKVRNADFSRARAGGVIFVAAQGNHANFREADLSKCCITGESVFESADFSGAVLEGAGMLGTKFRYAGFRRSNLSAANFMECDLRNADLSEALALQTRFDKANLEEANLAATNAMECSMRKARLTGTDLRDSNFYSAEFMKTKIGNTRFEGANLDKTKLADWGNK